MPFSKIEIIKKVEILNFYVRWKQLVNLIFMSDNEKEITSLKFADLENWGQNASGGGQVCTKILRNKKCKKYNPISNLKQNHENHVTCTLIIA